MEVVVTRQFEKDVEKELSKPMQLKLAKLIEALQQAPSLDEVADVKKLKGYKTAYRIRMGEYRIGFILKANTIKLSRVMNRKEIYRYFP
jgi:mRNA interferase RelE/StbE